MKEQTKRLLIVGGVAATIGLVAFYIQSMQGQVLVPASAQGPTVVGTVVTVEVSAGTMPAATLSLSSQNTILVTAPTGGTIQTVSATGSLTPSLGGSSYEYTATTTGSGSISVSWTDSSGATQSTTIPVTINA
jgi:hypothetical protein